MQKRGIGCTVRQFGRKYYVKFRLPKTGLQIQKSLQTTQASIAFKYKELIDDIINDPEHKIPELCPPVVKEIFGTKMTTVLVSGVKRIKYPVHNPWAELLQIDTLPDLSRGLTDEIKQRFNKGLLVQIASLSKEVGRLQEAEQKWELEKAASRETVKKLQDQVMELTREINYWKGRRLSKTECGTLEQEQTKYIEMFKQRKLKRDYIKDVCFTIERFVREFGPKLNVAEVDEHKINTWLQTYRKPDGGDITERRRKFIRTTVLKFLTTVTNKAFDRDAIEKVSYHRMNRERKEIIWLDQLEAERLVNAMRELHGDYWGDVARIQLDMGWRPEELTMLRSELATDRVITLDVVDGIAPKTGKRSVQVQTTTRDAVRRRLSDTSPLLFPRRGFKGKTRRPRVPRAGPIQNIMWYGRTFDRVFLSLLKAAKEKAQIKKPIDCRTLRRTFGSLQLRNGRRDIEVAALMGDLVETVRRHYARILAEEVSTELKASTASQDNTAAAFSR
jgi:hypothetical protein